MSWWFKYWIFLKKLKNSLSTWRSISKILTTVSPEPVWAHCCLQSLQTFLRLKSDFTTTNTLLYGFVIKSQRESPVNFSIISNQFREFHENVTKRQKKNTIKYVRNKIQLCFSPFTYNSILVCKYNILFHSLGDIWRKQYRNNNKI